jgi:hypothetical protein
MHVLLRTTDVVLISFVDALLTEAGIGFIVADRQTSGIEGSLSILPCRVLVAGDDAVRARQILSEAGLVAELEPPAKP